MSLLYINTSLVFIFFVLGFEAVGGEHSGKYVLKRSRENENEEIGISEDEVEDGMGREGMGCGEVLCVDDGGRWDDRRGRDLKAGVVDVVEL